MASHGKKWGERITVAALVGALFTGGWVTSSVREFVCKTAIWQAFGQLACDAQFRTVSVQEANRALSYYFGRAAGAEKQNAWAMLRRSESLPQAPESWLNEWIGVVFAERIGDVEQGDDYNEFHVHYRTYSKPVKGVVSVRDWGQTFVVWHQDGGSYMLDTLDNRTNPKQAHKRFPTGVVTQPVVWRNSPVNGSQFNSAIVGEQHFIYCEISVAGQPWVRTEVGFIPGDSIRVSRTGTHPPDECDAHYARDALGLS